MDLHSCHELLWWGGGEGGVVGGWWCFFFQAEDGIRDLVRSRGLGDVYKRQEKVITVQVTENGKTLLDKVRNLLEALQDNQGEESVSIDGKKFVPIEALKNHPKAVSYTHLTLPTSDLV